MGAVLFLQGKNNQVVEVLQNKMEEAVQQLNFEFAAHYRDQITRLRQIQDRQYVNITAGNADIIGLAVEAGVICIQLLSLRDGQVLGSRSYFPSVPAYSSTEEIIAAFLKQHYLTHLSSQESIPREIIIEVMLHDRALLEQVLTEQAKRKVELTQATRGEKKKWLLMAMMSAKQSLIAHLFEKTNIQERAVALQALLHLPTVPHRIECFDISHSMGEATVASCVVFDQTGPLKSAYRRFNIMGITPGDDVAAMRQVLLRRFKRVQKEGAPLPAVILIDGGKTQLTAALNVMTTLNIHEVLLVGVAKGPTRKPGYETLYMKDHSPIHLPADSLALHFIQQIRDEAHRFAITGHRLRRDKSRRHSSLELIPGVGVKRRRDLLRYFGGIQGVIHASLDELSKVPGISRSLAERIYVALHDASLYANV